MCRLARAALLGLLLLCPALGLGQSTYPNRALRMIVPFAPGGASDFVARIMAPKLSELLGEQIVVDNRPGASGNIAMDAAAKARADGYTIYLGNIGTIAINPAIFPNLAVNPALDFIAVTLVADVPSILVANPSVPVNSVADLVALAKARPGELNFASPGSSTLNRLELTPVRADAGSRYKKVSANLHAIQNFFVEAFLQQHPTPPARIVLDLLTSVQNDGAGRPNLVALGW